MMSLGKTFASGMAMGGGACWRRPDRRSMRPLADLGVFTLFLHASARDERKVGCAVSSAIDTTGISRVWF